jgi:hypothetical protein
MAQAPRPWARPEVRTRWVPPEEALRSWMPLRPRPAMRRSSGATTADQVEAGAGAGAAADRDHAVLSQTRRAAASATRSVACAPKGLARARGLRRPSSHSRAARHAQPRPSSSSRRAAFRSSAPDPVRGPSGGTLSVWSTCSLCLAVFAGREGGDHTPEPAPPLPAAAAMATAEDSRTPGTDALRARRATLRSIALETRHGGGGSLGSGGGSTARSGSRYPGGLGSPS